MHESMCVCVYFLALSAERAWWQQHLTTVNTPASRSWFADLSLHWKKQGFLGEVTLGLEYLADGHVSERL